MHISLTVWLLGGTLRVLEDWASGNYSEKGKNEVSVSNIEIMVVTIKGQIETLKETSEELSKILSNKFICTHLNNAKLYTNYAIENLEQVIKYLKIDIENNDIFRWNF
jgi:hypothetical protein